MHKKLLSFLLLGLVGVSSFSYAASVSIPIKLISGDNTGTDIGTIQAEDSLCGVLLKPNLHSLPPGVHGFHVHEKPSCDNMGKAAGGHLDPGKTDQHNGPYAKTGHLGDLPVLIVDQDGTAKLPTLTPNFTVKKLMGHALVIHAGGDNYSDTPEKLGGGGDRLACGIIGGIRG
jgi:Cu-Zn family superoxide dismutase